MALIPPQVPLSNPALKAAADGRVLSYGELLESRRLLAREMRLDRKRLVFSYFRNDPASILNYLACLEAGHAVFLCDPGAGVEQQRQLLRIYQPDLALSSQAADEAFLPPGQYREFRNSGGGVWWLREPLSGYTTHPDLAVLLSTSGSTGSAKLVRLTLENVESNARSIAAALELHAGERPVTSLPLHYSYGLSVLNSHLRVGAQVVVTGEGMLSAAFWKQFSEEECTSFAGVPYSYQLLKRLDPYKLPLRSLRNLTQAGGKLQPDLIAYFHAFAQSAGARFWVMYGQTEAAARISILPAGELERKLGSVGLPIPDGRLAACAGERPLGPGETGELVYTGPNVMMGYARGPEDLAKGDELGGRLYTGDLGYLDEEGYCWVTGRSKRIVKITGFRIDLDELEQMVRADLTAAVVGGDNQVVIFTENGSAEQFTGLAAKLSRELRLHASCFVFRRVEALPLHGNGKIDYPKLQEMA